VAMANVPRVLDRDELFPDKSETEAFHHFWLCPWFSRVWVLQEVALASIALVFYGPNSISFSEVMQAAYILSWREDLQENFHVGRWADAFSDTLITYTAKETWMQEKRLLRCWQSALAQRSPPTVHKILYSSSRFMATNPLDHIYGFLAHPAARSKDGTSGIIQADYTITIDGACLRLAESLYERDQRLDFLCSLSHWNPSDIDDFLSWVPRIHMPKLAYAIGHETWQADGAPETKDLVKAVFQGNKLHCLGFLFDEIGWCTERFVWASFERPGLIPVETSWNLVVESRQDSHERNALRSLRIAMVGGVYVGGDAALEQDFAAYCREKASSQFCSDMGLDDLENDGKTSLGNGNWQRFHRSHFNDVQGRKFFITGDQGRFGIGPAILEEGDLCCILMGCHIPLIIRPMPTRSHFKVLGPAFIENAMQGGLTKALIKSASDLMEIILI
jgi:hypothetical protein